MAGSIVVTRSMKKKEAEKNEPNLIQMEGRDGHVVFEPEYWPGVPTTPASRRGDSVRRAARVEK